MAIKVDYVVKETARNLIRSPWLTVATTLTLCVALTLVGTAFLVRTAVANTTQQWGEDVELIIYMQPEADPAQVEQVRTGLEQSPQVEAYEYLDRDAAYAEFQELFQGPNYQELREATAPGDVPTNFKVQPREASSEVVEALSAQFEQQAVVRDTVAALDTIKTLRRVSGGLSIGLLVAAGALALAALVLVANTIQTAMFARRREIEVMKLVGATNWFIRVPFMLEGVLQGLVGALLGVGGVYGLNYVFKRFVSEAEGLDLFRNFVASGGEVLPIAFGLVVAGVLLGAVASAFAVTFYLDV